MSDFPTTARVVIIGGGVVGTSTLFHLARAGWTDCVLLEKNELTAGSTWHAAGNCPNFAPNWAVMNMQRFGLELYRGLAEEVDYPMNYHVTGAIRLAHSKERMQEFEKISSQARYQGLTMDVCTPDELREHNPFMETHDLAGGLWDALDGDIDPAQLTQALAKGARDAGARIERFCPVTGLDRDGDEWIVKTDKGEIRAQYVVNCAGYYAQRVGEMFKPFGGRTVPMVVMSHQYFLTGQLPELEAWTKEKGHKMPMIRDPDISYYLRQDKYGLNLGPYERNCKAHWVTPEDPMPEDFSFQLYPDDLERLEFYIEDAMERLPLLGEGGVERNINGPIPYAPDGLPMIGPMPGVKNAFEGHSFTFGIAQGGGAGKVLSEWIMHGETEMDMWSVDPRRYTDYADHDYCHAKALETYGHEYAMHFPQHEWPAGRDKKLSAVHDRHLAAGGQMGAYNGWERANWYAKDGDDTSEETTQTWSRLGPWTQRVKEEVEAVRDNVGVLDLCGFSRFKLTGPGARAWLDTRTVSRLPSVGRVGLAYFADDRGRIVTEMSVFPSSDEEIVLITAAAAQWHDYEVLWRNLPEGLTLTDMTRDQNTLIVTGPKSRELFEAMGTDADLTKGWLTFQDATVAGKPCRLARVSFAGELGWEIHSATDDAPHFWDAVVAAGAKPFGMYALDSMRVEKAYRAWKGDLSTDYTLNEGALERFMKLDKEADFPGKAALTAEKAKGAGKRFSVMTIDCEEFAAPYMSPVWKGDEIIGETTSGAWGHRVGANMALGMLRMDCAGEGTEVEVEIYGKRYPAKVHGDGPAWDPANERLRA